MEVCLNAVLAPLAADEAVLPSTIAGPLFMTSLDVTKGRGVEKPASVGIRQSEFLHITLSSR